MQPSMLAKRLWSFLFLAVAAFYLYGLGAVPLVGPDEPRYAQVAREMLVRHDLITPTLSGLPWFEKPPLPYWMMMASYRVFGVSEFSARLGPAICGLLTALFVYWIAAWGTSPNVREGSEHTQPSRNDLSRYSALAFLSSLGVIVFARAASFDIVLTMTVTGAFACFFIWQVRYRTRSGSDGIKANPPPARINLLLLACYFFIGLSLLAKGLIGVVIPFGVIACYFLLRREWPPRKFVVSLFWGAPLALAVAAVWYGPMIARHGWTFIDQFIVQHHFARFLTNKYHHRQPFYYYVMTLAWLIFPWLIFFGSALVSAREWRWRGAASIDRLRAFVLAWFLVPFIFFSLSESKLAAYILPVVPAAALMVGDRITHLLRARKGALVIRLTSLLLLLTFVPGVWYAIRTFNIGFACAIGIALVPIISAAFALFARRMPQTVFILFALSTLGAAAVALNCAAPLVVRGQSVRDLLSVARQRGYGTTPVVQLFAIQRTAEFYAAGRLTYRPDGEPKRLESVQEVADAARRNGGEVLCLVPMEHEALLFQYQELQSEELTNNGKVGLVVSRLR